MSHAAETPEILATDREILDLLRERDGRTVTELSAALGVTATAVRQRITRLLALELIARETEPGGRGRPSHRYSLTEAGARQAGSNFNDLATVLWQELRAIEDPEIRRGLLARLATRMAGIYAGRIEGETVAERMESLAELFRGRRIPFVVTTAEASPEPSATRSGGSDGGASEGHPELPVLRALACPYPELAEMDRTICSMERLMFGELLGERVRLESCRLDGDPCCTFAAAVS